MHRGQKHNNCFFSAGRRWRYRKPKQQGLGFCCWKTDATARNEPTLYHPVIVRLTAASLHSVPSSFNRMPALTNVAVRLPHPVSHPTAVKIIFFLIGPNRAAGLMQCRKPQSSRLRDSRGALCCVSHLKEALTRDDAPVGGRRRRRGGGGSRSSACAPISCKEAWHQGCPCGQSCSNLDSFKEDSPQPLQLVCTANSCRWPVCANTEVEKGAYPCLHAWDVWHFPPSRKTTASPFQCN